MNRRVKQKKQLSGAAEVWRRFKKSPTAMVGLVIVSVILFCAVFADLIVPYEAGIKQVLEDRLQGPSIAHPFGTDDLGRDLFARVIMAPAVLWPLVSVLRLWRH